MGKTNRPYIMRAYGYWHPAADAARIADQPALAPLLLPRPPQASDTTAAAALSAAAAAPGAPAAPSMPSAPSISIRQPLNPNPNPNPNPDPHHQSKQVRRGVRCA